MMSALWQEWEGRIVDRAFQLERRLGSTAHSAVFLTAIGEPEPRNAAIKFAWDDPPDPELPARWQHAAQLPHPHLIGLFQTGTYEAESGALPYVVMEYAEEDLAGVLRERALSADEATELLQSVVDALAYIHGQGLAHGHLKPANIMAVSDRLKISSDGIGAPGKRPAGAISAYDAPEVRDAGFSPAGDVWSLGVMLVEALTQQIPVRGGPNDEPIVPATLPAPFLKIAQSCLRRDPRQRATIAEVQAQLRPSVEPERATPIEPVVATPRRRYIVPVAAVVTGLVAGIGLLYYRTTTRPSAPEGSAVVRVQETPEPKPAPPEKAPPPQTGIAERQSVPDAKPAPPPKREPPAKAPDQTAAGPVVRQVMPEIPGKARTTIHGTVRVAVRVQVDAGGHVTNARLDSPGPSSYFANLTLQAARRWEFAVTNAQGQPVPSEWLLRFQLTNAATKVSTVRVSH